MSTCNNVNDNVKISTLLRHVIPTINNIPHDLGVDLLRQAATEFLRRTQLLAVQIEVPLQRGVVDYELQAPKDYEIHNIREAGHTGRMVHGPPDYWCTSYGTKFKVVSNKYIVLGNEPSRDATERDPFYAVATVTPGECLQTLPREITVPYGRYIAKGALAEALMYKSKPWYDPNLAQKMERDFNIGVNAGKNLQIMNRGGSDMIMRGKRWV